MLGTRQKPMPFIVGSFRSGTTLLRFMLDSHSQIAIPPETGFLMLDWHVRGSISNVRSRFFEHLLSFPPDAPAWEDFGILKEEFRLALKDIEPFNCADGFRCFYRLYAKRFGKPRWGDKTPMYCMHLNTIREVLPEAHFIHVIRDGRDVAQSLRQMWFSPGWEPETQAKHWMDCVCTARSQGAGDHAYMEVRFEDLILHPWPTLQEICHFLDLTPEETMLRYHERASERLREHKARHRSDGTTIVTQEMRFRQQALTETKPDASRVSAWRTTMNQSDRTRFQSVAGDLLRELGYPL